MSRSGAFVGRSAELAKLRDFVSDAPGGGRLAIVAGEAGVGKTRLVDELVAAATGSVRVVRGRADEHEAEAFDLWLSPLNQLGLPRPGTDSSVPTSEQRWDVVDLLAGTLRDASPILLVLDDLHWADDDALWVLDHLLENLSDRAVTIVATTRPSSEARSTRWHGLYRRADVIALDGLDVAEVAELAAHVGGAPADARALWERTGGNPLFVRELLRTGGDGRMPSTVNDVLVSAIEQLGPDTANVVSLISLAGGDTPAVVLAAACALTIDEIDRHIDAARRADILRDTDSGSLRFRHDLLAEAAARRIPRGEHQRLHRAIADAWGSVGGPAAGAIRARHQLLAVPAVDPAEAATAALAAAADLRATGNAADAATLLHLARQVLGTRGDVPDETKARIALAEGEARWALDDMDQALGACDEAIVHATAAADPALRAAAEVAALTHHNPFEPDPVRVARLADVDAALPAAHDAVEPALRIRLRGRRAIMSMSLPGVGSEAIELGDDAVARARALGDPDVICGALRDRLFILPTPADMDAKADAAAEIVHLARTSGRPALGLLGHEWTYATRIAAGDLTGAIAALTDLEALAAIMPSPYWRYSAALRRCVVLALLGDYEGAISLCASARRLATGLVADAESVGLDFGLRFTCGLVYGRDDHGADLLMPVLSEMSAHVPVLFLQARLALAEAFFGDSQSALRRLTPWLHQFAPALYTPEGLPTVAVLAHAAVLLRWEAAAAELRIVLQPFAGRYPAGNGVPIDLPIDHHLAALALLEGDTASAVTSAQAAVAFARRMKSPPVEARALALLADATAQAGDRTSAASARDAAETIADPIGMLLPPATWATRPVTATAQANPATAPGVERAVSLQLDNGRWFIDSPYGSGHVADAAGLRHLVELLSSPGRDIAAVDLVGADRGREVVVSSDLGPALDGRAKREYRRRITELQADIDEAEDHNDVERAAKHRMEMEALIGELRAAVGLGGRDRPQGSGAERARINASRNIRRSIAAIATVLPELGAHLNVSIRTGHQCSYSPEPAAALTWRVAH